MNVPEPTSSPASGSPARRSSSGPKRRGWRPLRDLTSLVWLVAAVVISIVHRWVPNSTWLMIHLVLLGALTHAAMVWSEHFAHTLLRMAETDDVRRSQDWRTAVLAAGAAAVFVGYPGGWWPLTVAGAAAVTAAVVWHAARLLSAMRRALPARFRVVSHYYVAAAVFLPVGAAVGATLAFGLGTEWHGRALVAHMAANLLGWIGLTVTGTLITFWPTMLRVRMDDRAETLARQALPLLIGGIVVITAGTLVGLLPVSLAGLTVYAAGLVWWGRALHRPLRLKGLREFAPASVAAALVWAIAGLIWVGFLLATSPTWEAFTDGVPVVAGVLVVGFALQLLTGALSYLVPSVAGGGPAVVRAAQTWLNRWSTWRLVVINGGLLLWLMPVASWVKVITSALVLVGLVMFLPFVVLGARASARAKTALATEDALDHVAPRTSAPHRHDTAGSVSSSPAERRSVAARAPAPGSAASARVAATQPAANSGAGVPSSVWSANQLIAGLAALVLAVTVGVGLDPAASGLGGGTGGTPPAEVVPTGNTTRVEVTARGMTFYPSSVTVPRGDRLVVVLTNDDGSNMHDLMIGTARTPRLRAGETVELDVGVIGASMQGWCTVAGHRQMGMVFDVIVEGSDASGGRTAGGSGEDQGGMRTGGGHQGGHGAGVDTGSPGSGAVIPAQPDVVLSSMVDPVLPPLGDERVHEVTLTVTEVPLEVAPGLWQTRWTFNGGSVGPTLHGRVGDVFEVTLVNDGTIGHSIDFHAGALAPDRPMRTIEPGESLVYRFTAERAGIWMYHCSTMPMSTHIAAGMTGAVVIEPDGLPTVDHSFVLVQSEVFLAGVARGPGEASEVDSDKVVAERPDRVVFNGVANQYDQFPFRVKVGERIRFWVLDSGPNRPSAFHVVGGQFDTVWREGRYELRDGVDAFGSTGGGSQVLSLLPAEGGFVELVMPEAGHYTVVSHIMVDAERGAHGIIEVID